ncbi:TPA: glycine cleavage system protein GcvH [Candidatus Galligastranaerophilus gallistercoris]|nr:glycine cleavage system protein GcvH [Candidatus Galligastranaerophilus gallistercoris]
MSTEETKVPEGILCSNTHEWVLEEGKLCTIGLTDYAIEQLGDVVFVELPEIGSEFAKNEVFATIESVKAASEIYMPVGGKVVEVNEELINSPEIINEDPYEKGWLIKIEASNMTEDSVGLLEYEDYKEEVA